MQSERIEPTDEDWLEALRRNEDGRLRLFSDGSGATVAVSRCHAEAVARERIAAEQASSSEPGVAGEAYRAYVSRKTAGYSDEGAFLNAIQPLVERAQAASAAPREMPPDVRAIVAAKDAAYGERDRVVAAFARLARAFGWTAGMARHVGGEWEDDWRNIVYVETPAGQVSWHVHDSEMPLFRDLPRYEGAWDGHTTDEKYARLDALEAAYAAPTARETRDLTDDERARLGRQIVGEHITRAIDLAEDLPADDDMRAKLLGSEGGAS